MGELRNPEPGELKLVGPAPGQKPPAPMSTQRKARKQALDLLFEAELLDESLATRLAADVADAERPPLRELGHDIVAAVIDHAETIDAAIEDNLTGRWSLMRMPRVDRCLTRMAVAEMWFVGTPTAVVINEAVALAETFSTDDSAGFLNGVLGRIAVVERPDVEAAGAASDPNGVADEAAEEAAHTPED
ncbi:transcription antitermination factor NusB [Propioniferax innocua]|uniref:Transcription antitermination protein NusB n=2 Tax=Propioniferax innocua TaxID=1753 RepID=A0A542ZQ61_9ACTN|nr:NusB antitermination factor [Propioniferax innocua]